MNVFSKEIIHSCNKSDIVKNDNDNNIRYNRCSILKQD